MSTLQHRQLTFNKNITLANDGGKISSDSGLILIKEFMNRIGFSSILEEQVKLTDSRRNVFFKAFIHKRECGHNPGPKMNSGGMPVCFPTKNV